MVPEVGLEPTRTKSTLDFESSASTNSTTPAPEKTWPAPAKSPGTNHLEQAF